MDVVKIGMIGIIGVLLAIQFKSSKPEFSLLITFGSCLVIFAYSVYYFESVVSVATKFTTMLKEDNQYIKIILKVIGITYICEFCAGVCKDSGYGAIANQIEVFGKLSILFSGIPIIVALIETVQNF